MKKLLTYLFIGLFTVTFSTAQQALINGIIIDASNGEGLISATIKSGITGTTSDLDGRYQLRVPSGEQLIEFSYLGYATITKKLTLADDETLTLDIQLGETATLLETATVSSSKFEKPLGEVTVSLEVLKADLIANTNATSITQPLQKISGVNIIDGQANIRGGSGWSYGAGSRVLLLIDDIPALQADAGFPNWVDVPVENIAQVEIVKGAASALYGSSAMNGIINIRTAYATSEPFTRISTFFKLYDSPKDEAKKWWDKENTFFEFDDEGIITDTVHYSPKLFGGHKGYNLPGQLGLSVAHRQKLGKTDLILGAYGIINESYRQADYSKYARFNAGIKHRINDNLSVGFNSNFNRGVGRSTFYWANHSDSTGTYLPDISALSNSNRFRFTIDPYLNYFDAAGNQHKILTRYYGINNKNDNNQGNKSSLYYTEYQFLKRWEDLNLNLTTGIVGTWSHADAELYNGIYNSANYAAFLQLDKKLFDRLNLSFGTRYEINQQKNPDFIFQDSIVVFKAGTDRDSKPVFRFGANYQAAEYTFLRASWGQGYRFPVLAERFILTTAGGITVIPNPSLIPETGWSAEIGIKQGFKVSNFNGYLDVALFASEYNDMMEFGLNLDTIFGNFIAFQSNNVGNTRITGIDFSLAGEGALLGMPTTLLAGYTYIKPIFQDFTEEVKDNSSVDYNVLKYRYRHTLKFDVESRFQMFSLGLAAIYNSKMEAIDEVLGAINNIDAYRAANDHGYTTVDLRLAFIPNKHIRISLIGANILNEEYMNRPGLLDGPRSYTLRLDYTL